MSAIVPFNFEHHDVRIEDRDGQPWFVAADICAALEIANHSHAITRLEDDERGSLIVHTLGGPQSVAAVNESGMYALIMRSRKAAAKRFRKWVTAEVLPSIRKTGGYGAPPSVATLAALDHDTLRALLLGKVDRLDELEPKAEAFDRIADARGALNLTEAAKALKVGRSDLIRWMQAKAWIYRGAANGRWMAYRAKEQALLLEHRVTRIPRPNEADRIVTSVMVTPKGLARLATDGAGRTQAS